MGHNPQHIMELAAGMIEKEGGLTEFITNYGFGGILFALFAQIIKGIDGVGTVVLGPVRALGEGMIFLVDQTFVNLIRTFDAGTQATMLSFKEGIGAALGIFAQPVSVGIMMLSFAVFLYAINRIGITPISFIRSIRRGR